MTTIAWDTEGNLACDSLATTGGTVDQYPCKKVFKRLGAYYATGGDYAQCVAMIDWLTGKSEQPVFTSPNFELLVIRKGKGVCFTDEYHPYKVEPPFSLGTGAHFAYGAMLSGKSAKQAVKIAMKLDPSTGGRVKSYAV